MDGVGGLGGKGVVPVFVTNMGMGLSGGNKPKPQAPNKRSLPVSAAKASAVASGWQQVAKVGARIGARGALAAIPGIGTAAVTAWTVGQMGYYGGKAAGWWGGEEEPGGDMRTPAPKQHPLFHAQQLDREVEPGGRDMSLPAALPP